MLYSYEAVKNLLFYVSSIIDSMTTVRWVERSPQKRDAFSI